MMNLHLALALARAAADLDLVDMLRREDLVAYGIDDDTLPDSASPETCAAAREVPSRLMM